MQGSIKGSLQVFPLMEEGGTGIFGFAVLDVFLIGFSVLGFFVFHKKMLAVFRFWYPMWFLVFFFPIWTDETPPKVIEECVTNWMPR